MNCFSDVPSMAQEFSQLVFERGLMRGIWEPYLYYWQCDITLEPKSPRGEFFKRPAGAKPIKYGWE
jgi:hypothetical protein